MDDPSSLFAPGRTFFYTAALADPRSTLLTERIDALGAAFRAARARHPFDTLAIVVLPDHLHCLLTLPPDADAAARWRLVKRAFTERQQHEGPRAGRLRPLWRPRYCERPIADADDLRAHVACIHLQPVRHGLVSDATAWPHSSLHRYRRHGWLDANLHLAPIERALGDARQAGILAGAGKAAAGVSQDAADAAG